MFKPNDNEDRLDYGKLLLPPEGFRLDMAVGTTYSLDLEALTAVAICLGSEEETDSAFMQNPVNNLHALEKVSDEILIFCEAGQTKMPGTHSALTLLLEKMVTQVALPKDESMGNYPAFHPKTWTLSYVNEDGEYRYRYIVMSRNLTFDRSWDISFAMDGVPGSERPEKTKPILSFLDYLASQVQDTYPDDAKKKEKLQKLLNRLQNVSFRLNSKEFGEEFEVLPMGIGENSYDMSRDDLFCDEKYTARYSFHELIVMSPFLSGSIIESLNQEERAMKDCRRTLITRRSELGKLKPEQANHFDIYVLKDEMADDGDSPSGADAEPFRQDIHAKIFLRRKDSNTSLYFGSMNATYAALHNNVEMMVRLRTKKGYLDGKKFLNDLFCGPADERTNPFIKVTVPEEQLPDPEEDRRHALEIKIKELCRREKKAAVTETLDGRYQVTIQFEKDVQDENLLLSPLRSAQKKTLGEQIQFEALELLQISEFYEVTAVDREIEMNRVIMIPTAGIPEARDSAIVNSVVKDRETFVEYVALVLGDDNLTTLMEQKQIGESGFFRNSNDAMPALYEKMLRVALEDKDRLKDIDTVLKMITDEEIVPKEFRETYEMFCRTLKLN